ncbi:DUF943 family protein [Pseudescherichia sp.]|uniref:DUF943 family protein n=1 Tax=Pseudescherichia sp. TaxID=2055881 RepID=UPI00289782E2|nr:DUF943 family protein [Pseudescherichia sp.]
MKKNSILGIVIAALALGFFFVKKSIPVEVMAVDATPNTVLIAVKGLPHSAKSKLSWWLDNKSLLISEYKLDFTEPDEQPSVYIYDFSDGFKKEEMKDRLCFDSVSPPNNCIDKNIDMVISQLRNGEIKLAVDDDVFIEDKSGKIVKQSPR